MFLVEDIYGPFTGRSCGKKILSSKGKLEVYSNGDLLDTRNNVMSNWRDTWERYCYIKKWLKEE